MTDEAAKNDETELLYLALLGLVSCYGSIDNFNQLSFHRYALSIMLKIKG